MGTPTEIANPLGVAETWKKLQPSLEKQLARELEARVPAYMESEVSERVDPIIVTRADWSARRVVVTLSRSNLLLRTLTDSLRLELDARLPREKAPTPLPVIQNSTYAFLERQKNVSTAEQWRRVGTTPVVRE